MGKKFIEKVSRYNYDFANTRLPFYKYADSGNNNILLLLFYWYPEKKRNKN